MITCGDYIVLRKIGSGGFADVFLARHQHTGNLCALKVMVRGDEFTNEYEDFISQEIEVMKELQHPNIMNLLDSKIQATMNKSQENSFEVCFLALEIASGGDFFDYIAQTGRFSEDITRYFFHQMIDAFEYMNKQGISHRDIKPDNILLDSEFNIKISDFGWASQKQTNTTQAGTLQYMAPEIGLMDKYNPA